MINTVFRFAISTEASSGFNWTKIDEEKIKIEYANFFYAKLLSVWIM